MTTDDVIDNDWHNSKETNEALRVYHDKYATHKSRSTTNKCRSLNHKVLQEINRCLRKEGLTTQMIYLGSVYEATNVANSYNGEVEFDVAYIYVDPNIGFGETDLPGYSTLMPRNEEGLCPFLRETLTPDGYLDRETFYQKLFSFMQQIIQQDEIKEERKRIFRTAQLETNGPAIALKVRDEKKSISFKTDVVFVFGQADDALCCIAKPPKCLGLTSTAVQNSKYWKDTTSIRMKKQFEIMSEYAKITCRIIKAIKLNTPQLHLLTSYQLKTIVLRNFQTPGKMSEDAAGRNLFNCLKDLSNCLGEGYLPNYFPPEENLFEKLDEKSMIIMKDLIDNLIAKKEAFYDILK